MWERVSEEKSVKKSECGLSCWLVLPAAWKQRERKTGQVYPARKACVEEDEKMLPRLFIVARGRDPGRMIWNILIGRNISSEQNSQNIPTPEINLKFFLLHCYRGGCWKSRDTEEIFTVFFLTTGCVFSNSAGKILTPNLGLGTAPSWQSETTLSFFLYGTGFYIHRQSDRILFNLIDNSTTFEKQEVRFHFLFICSLFCG